MTESPATNAWPFVIELLATETLFADKRYQRPPQDSFVEKLISTFDPTLVGTLDVSARDDHRYALLDGLQRHSAIVKMGYSHIWCAVYAGMSVEDEARFFYRRNRDRRSVHPFYQFRARILMRDEVAVAVDKIVRKEGFKLHINARPDDHLTAIRAVEDVYGYRSLDRHESLTPALRTIRESLLGRKGATDGNLIRGLGRFFQAYPDDELDHQWLFEALAEMGPLQLLGRVKDRTTGQGGGKGSSLLFAREIAELYNKGRKGQRLSLRAISGSPKKEGGL